MQRQVLDGVQLVLDGVQLALDGVQLVLDGVQLVLDGVQLVCGENSTMEKKEQTMRAGWASDPVHPNGHIYAEMALNLIEKIAPAMDGPGASVPETGREHGAQATGRRVRVAAADTGSRTAAAAMADKDATMAAAEAPTASSGNTTAGTAVMEDPDPDPAEFPTEVQPGKQEGRAVATRPLAKGAEGPAADRPEEAAAVVSAVLPEWADTATTKPPTVPLTSHVKFTEKCYPVPFFLFITQLMPVYSEFVYQNILDIRYCNVNS